MTLLPPTLYHFLSFLSLWKIIKMHISIAQPPWTGLGKRLESTMRKALFDFKMLEGINRICVALSGGKDSLTLLFLLKAISGRGFPALDIHAVHIHGAFSCGAGIPIEYLKGICDQLQVELHTRESTQELETLECYSCSRERRGLLFEVTKKIGAQAIAFGHHRDDNAQTIMMNLLNKGEFAGNLPKIHMHDYGVTIIRPLIYISEEDIRNFAKHHGFMRMMCQCPVGQNSMRKKVDILISEIEATYPNARENIARAGLVYGSDKASRK